MLCSPLVEQPQRNVADGCFFLFFFFLRLSVICRWLWLAEGASEQHGAVRCAVVAYFLTEYGLF